MFNVGLLVSPIITREILHADIQKLNPCSVSRGTDQVDREREREGSYKDDSFGRSRILRTMKKVLRVVIPQTSSTFSFQNNMSRLSQNGMRIVLNFLLYVFCDDSLKFIDTPQNPNRSL